MRVIASQVHPEPLMTASSCQHVIMRVIASQVHPEPLMTASSCQQMTHGQPCVCLPATKIKVQAAATKVKMQARPHDVQR